MGEAIHGPGGTRDANSHRIHRCSLPDRTDGRTGAVCCAFGLHVSGGLQSRPVRKPDTLFRLGSERSRQAHVVSLSLIRRSGLRNFGRRAGAQSNVAIVDWPDGRCSNAAPGMGALKDHLWLEATASQLMPINRFAGACWIALERAKGPCELVDCGDRLKDASPAE